MKAPPKEFFESFPVITLEIDEERINWYPNQYFVKDILDNNKYCIGIDPRMYFSIIY